MFCSTIIPTIGRESLSSTVKSVLDQEILTAEHEVIVVNDSGQSLESADWQFDTRVCIIDSNRRERSVARNAGAAIARGKYLHFLDDDDWLLPGALQAFWQLAQENEGAGWLYGSYQTVDNNGNIVEVIRPGIIGDIFALTIVGESIPFQASLLLADQFHAVGGFDPHPAIIGVEDRDVGRRMAFGSKIAWSPEIVAQIRIGEVNSTTNWKTIAESDCWGREKALRLYGVPGRLRQSAKTSKLNRRVSRAYLASAVWNLRRYAGFTAISRALTSLMFAGLSIIKFRP